MGEGPSFVVAGDFDRDGKVDLAVADYYEASVTVRLRSGSSYGSAMQYGVGNKPLQPVPCEPERRR